MGSACPQCGWADGFHDRAIHELPFRAPADWTLWVGVGHDGWMHETYVDQDERKHRISKKLSEVAK